MDKKHALTILIKNSYIFTDEKKAEIILKIDEMNDDQVTTIGKFMVLDGHKPLQPADASENKLKNLLGELHNSTL